MATTPVTSTTSSQFSLNFKDILKGLLVAVLTPVVTVLINSLQAGTLTFNWTAIGITALAAALAYLLKNFLTPSAIVVSAPPATVNAVKDGTQVVAVVDKGTLPFSTPTPAAKTSSKP